MTANQNLHRLFRAETNGYWYKLRPTKQHATVLKECQKKIREKLVQALQDEYGTSPKFRVQGSWAYGTCNQPALLKQEMDLDYGAYLPTNVFTENRSTTEAKRFYEVTQIALEALCREEKWSLDTSKKTCLRLKNVMPTAHIDIPLYAVPDDMFNDLEENHQIVMDSVQKAEESISFNRQLSLEQYGEVTLTEAVSIDLKNIQIIHMAMQDGNWKASDCEKVREWFLNICSQYPNGGHQLRSIVRYLKGWRDHQWETGGPTSILLMIIAVQNYQYIEGRDDKALSIVSEKLPNALLQDIYESRIDQHEEENFNKSNHGQRKENAEKALILYKNISSALEASNAQLSIDYLIIQFGNRIPNDQSLVSSSPDTLASSLRNSIYASVLSEPAQKSSDEVMLRPQIGG